MTNPSIASRLIVGCTLVFALLISHAYAWGPLLHQSLSSSVLGCLQNSTTVKRCFSKGFQSSIYIYTHTHSYAKCYKTTHIVIQIAELN